MSNSPRLDETQKISVDVINLLTWNLGQAAAVCGTSKGTFRTWVREGIMPQPFHGKRYSAADVKRALASFDIQHQKADAYDVWRAERG